MKYRRLISIIVFAVGLGWSGGVDAIAAVRWDMDALSAAPQVWTDPNRNVDDVKAVFYEGLPWQGKPTRVFAYYGVPEVAAGQKVPAMVLVHGGGGTAFFQWVKLWVERGYAAISMDTCGSVNNRGQRGRPRHDWSGPPGWGGFDQLDWPAEDQWTYHAVADVVLAHSLIRSLPEVDAERTGITGVSWGGYLTCIVAGIDHRFKFAVPVYGCGYLGDNSHWLETFEKMGPANAQKWLEWWDPSQYLPAARIPILWVTGTNDFAYPMDSLKKSYRLPQAPHTLCLRVRMPHGHGGLAFNAPETQVMAESMVNDGVPLVRITGMGRENSNAWVTFDSQAPIIKAELNYTTDTGRWQERNWQTVAATLDTQAGRVSATLPEGVMVYYLNLIDNRNLVVSSEHEEITPHEAKTGDDEM